MGPVVTGILKAMTGAADIWDLASQCLAPGRSPYRTGQILSFGFWSLALF